MKTLHVELGERSYPILIGQGLLDEPSRISSHLRHRQVLIVTNDVVAPLYLSRLQAALPGNLQVDSLVLPDGESQKNLASFARIMDALIDHGHHRSTTLIALGGGVIGDLTGFAAACYQRGVDFLQVPTTLLAMVDSSVGGKTAVNHPRGKNMIGAFHQPLAVIADTATLDTLAPREFAAGMAEVIKYGFIQDAPFVDWLLARSQQILGRDPATLSAMIARCCACKAAVVSEDETEQGRRAILNLGHTFGHAIEAWDGYRHWLHGEAVAVGMRMAADLSARLGWTDDSVLARLDQLLLAHNLPLHPPEAMQAEDFASRMKLDKKVQDGKVRLVLLRAEGEAVVTADYSAEALQATLASFTQRS